MLNKVYLKGPRISNKMRGKASFEKTKNLMNEHERNVRTAQYNTRISVRKHNKNSPEHAGSMLGNT